LIGAEHAHAALAAATRRRGEARLADQRTPALIVHRVCFFKPRLGALDLTLVHPLATSGTPNFKGLQCAGFGWGNLHFLGKGHHY
jgi:hypothetical protein